MSDEDRGKIRVRGFNIMQPPLFETTDARLIEFHDPFGALMALVYRVFNEDTWALSTKSDPDWISVLVRFGYIKPDKPIDEIIRNGL